jgi:predicted enzyme related to lactoylglutathione lyase
MNPVVHFEFPYDNRDRIARFYQTAFGWQLQMLGEEMGNYVIATTAQADAKAGAPAGAINGGFYHRNPDWPAQYPSVVISIPDVAAAMKSVTSAGGKVLGEPMDIPGVGRYVSFFDTEGNRVSMLQPLPGGMSVSG